MSSKVKRKILKLKESSTLVINEKSKDLISKGKKIYQFGFGQSPFPVPEKIVEALKKNAHRKEYLPIQGLPQLRENISKYLFERTGNNYPKENIFEELTNFLDEKPHWLTEGKISKKWFGIRSKPEGEPSPIMKNLEDGLIICTGFYKNGILLAPACSKWVANEIKNYLS